MSSAEDAASRLLRDNPTFLEEWLRRRLSRSSRLRESLLKAAERQEEEGGGDSGEDDEDEVEVKVEDGSKATTTAEEVIVAPPKAFLGTHHRLSPLPSQTEEDYTPSEEAHFR